ncbi:hypothetical protein PACTADRAFT_50687 [Pachysolen tannophilus NRRL Y-2460]|uniref:WD repeat-containing protein JIP5 n=1 Tax=Pachysolen tannophilus NRRL Y-2460 TaxID=669874 RepID=A0A1E4TSV3_PACTA|nr:hypothetical protein PACTADRAFT_50687 [Pachysolen tannophilus NRRL Y-2460]
MGKKGKRSNSQNAAAMLESQTRPILELTYDDPLFAFAAHPTKPLLASGLATGYVYMQSYDDKALEDYSSAQREKEKLLLKEAAAKKVAAKDSDKTPLRFKVFNPQSQNDNDTDTTFKICWKTKRHKGSVRSVIFDSTGENLYTAGTDKVIKKANSETGKVVMKTGNLDINSNITKMITVPNKPFLVAGTETGDIHVFDTRTLKQLYKLDKVHGDSVNSIASMYGVSDYQFVSVGSTTLAHFDIRKGIITTSENQEDELLSVSFVDPTNCETAVVGMGEGVISRIKISRDNSVDAVISTLDDDASDCIWTGSSDGIVRKVDTKRGAVIETRMHNLNDEIGFLDLDYDYRLISAGMENLKIWSNREQDEDEDENENESDWSSDEEEVNEVSEDDKSDSGSDSENGSESESASESEDSEVSDAESEPESNSKRGPTVVDSEEEEPTPKPKQKKPKINPKQFKNSQLHEHGIRKFDDL